MPRPVPPPLSTIADKARRLPGRAAVLPVVAISSALAALEAAEKEYTALAERGEQVVERWRGDAAPAPVRPSMVPHDTAAPPDVVDSVERAAGEMRAAGQAEPVTSHADLPLPDYDHMTLGSLRGRLRSLSLADLVVLRDYEKSRGDRLPVVTLLDNRIAKLAAADTAPTGTPSTEPAPEQRAAATPPASKVQGSARRPATPPRTKVRHT